MRSHAMPWKQSSAACEQKMFIEAWVKGEETVAQLCRRFEISRKTGYKRITRFREWGYDGLGDLSRAPRTHPNATSPWVCDRLIDLNSDQEENLVEDVASGRFRTPGEIADWVESKYGVKFKGNSKYSVLQRLGCSPKVPRSRHEKADVQALSEDYAASSS